MPSQERLAYQLAQASTPLVLGPVPGSRSRRQADRFCPVGYQRHLPNWRPTVGGQTQHFYRVGDPQATCVFFRRPSSSC